ncbi:hypothetical protein Q7C36_021523 [Tachysurus vachellii]|uniref:Uncharacterized protein n=1 Tax=Tachysurus vachellii TaxID=175792 RepID=A0AA88J9B9_TACVA|nr:hypothetical protein Q7C36_021523 [Tachysurus vachellii]
MKHIFRRQVDRRRSSAAPASNTESNRPACEAQVQTPPAVSAVSCLPAISRVMPRQPVFVIGKLHLSSETSADPKPGPNSFTPTARGLVGIMELAVV